MRNFRSLATHSLCFFLLAATAFGQDPQDNYRFPNPKNERANFFGDWGGSRSKLEQSGVTFRFSSTTDSLFVLHGGASNQAAPWTRIRGTIDIDFEKLTHTKGLAFHATGMWQTGVNVGDKLASFANPSGIGSVHVLRMDSYWLEQSLADGRLTFRAGQMAGWDFYGNQEFGEAFIIEPLNYAFGNMFSDTYLTYNPAGVPAAQVLFNAFRHNNESPVTGFYFKSGVFSGNQNPYVQDPTGLHFKIANSPVSASEVGFVFRGSESAAWPLPKRGKLYPGIYRFGGVVNPNGTFTNPLTAISSKGNYLWYFEAAQAVYRSKPGSLCGLDLTFGYDRSSNDVTQQNSMVTWGGRYHGIVPRREMDELDFGSVFTSNSPTASAHNELLLGFPLGWEKAYTLNYRAQLKPWLVFQPVAEYYATLEGNPNRRSGLVIGFRTYLRL